MDDAHAHPKSPANTLHTRARSIPNLRDSQLSQPTPKSAPHTRQQRLLQTRNAKFPGQRLSVNGIAVPFPQFVRASENDHPYSPGAARVPKRDDDGSGSDRTTDMTSTSPRSSIFNEITNSAGYRVRGLSRRAPIPVFLDSPDKRFTDHPGTKSPSVYHDAASDLPSPSRHSSTRDGSVSMGLREVSINLQRPSAARDSPYYRSIRAGLRRKSSHPKLRFNSEEYIDHIENELQLVKDAMYSPTSHMPWKEKLKKAQDDNDRLRKEMDLMRSSFEFELQQTVERSTETELRLKRKIKDLEDDIEHKQSLIHDLEQDQEDIRFDQNAVECLRAKIDKLEDERVTLEMTNRDMVKRNEVLTHLLALSPSKQQCGFELPTPRRKNARPMSMIISKIPSSPDQTPPSRPQSVIVSPALPRSSDLVLHSASSPLGKNLSELGLDSPRFPDDTQSIDSGLGASCSHVTNDSISRRSTLASHASTSPLLPPVCPAPVERPPFLARQPSKRRPRKFMPGSTQLKPLLLPTFTADNGNLPIMSPITSPNRPPVSMADHRPPWEPVSIPPTSSVSAVDVDTSLQLCDYDSGQPGPSVQNLAQVLADDQQASYPQGKQCTPASPARGSQYRTPNQRKSRDLTSEAGEPQTQRVPGARINSWVLKTISSMPDADQSASVRDARLEEDHRPHLLGGCPSPEIVSSIDESEPSLGFVSISSLRTRAEVEIPRPLFSEALATCPSPSLMWQQSSTGTPRKRRTSLMPASDPGPSDVKPPPDQPRAAAPGATDVRPILTPTSALKYPEVSRSEAKTSSSKRQSLAKARRPMEILQHANLGSKPLAALTIRTVYATLSRYTSYIRGLKQDPLALARRVIANAWRSNWASLGKLSWWVLGLFVGRRHPPAEQKSWDWDAYDGESIAQQCCAPEPADVSADSPEESCPPPTDVNQNDLDTPESQATGLPKPSANLRKPGWGRSLLLWGKFSVAIMLAVGGAIVKGPGEMLREADDQRSTRNSGNVDAQHPPAQTRSFPAPGQSDHLRHGCTGRRCDEMRRKEGMSSRPTIRKVRSFSSPLPVTCHLEDEASAIFRAQSDEGFQSPNASTCPHDIPGPDLSLESIEEPQVLQGEERSWCPEGEPGETLSSVQTDPVSLTALLDNN